MSHVYGHVDIPSQSFGVLLPRLEMKNLSADFSNKISSKCIVRDNGVVEFPILFLQKEKKFHAGNGGVSSVGFHPYLIPFEETFYVMASDVVDFKDHQESEKKAVGNDKIEKFHAKNDFIVDLLNDSGSTNLKPQFKKEEKEVLRQTLRYMNTSSFKKVYLDENRVRESNEVILWIVLNTIHLSQTGFTWQPGKNNESGTLVYK